MAPKTSQSTQKFAHIAIDVPVRTLFSYSIPSDLLEQTGPGKRVLVPFGKKQVVGLCVRVTDNNTVQEKNLKSIIQVIDDEPLLDDVYLDWLEFAADYYMCAIGQVIAQAVPKIYYNVKKLGEETKYKYKALSFESHFQTKDVVLTKEQQKVYENITDHIGEFYPLLLQGVTGSGKTEVYIQVIKKVLAYGKSALFLVPEIGLTPQMLARLNHHFKNDLLVYHSGLTVNQRLNQWQLAKTDTPKVMVGTRSALFAPFKKLGLIIVDEEHDHSYKQEERFKYHARSLAVSRAKHLKVPVIMGSATPSLESYYQVKKEKYHFYNLASRVGNAKLPDIRVINFGKEREQTGAPFCVSQHIHDAIDRFYKKNQQMLIFVGQRGFAQNAYCTACSEIQVCPNCSVGLTYHKTKRELKCHYCDYEILFSGECSLCKEKALTLLGFGTQTVEDEIKTMHPRVRVARLDSDVVKTEADLRRVFNDFARHKIDLIIGTQMISKGHDFSNVGFVGVLGIDAHLGLPDFRASERAYQNLVQVAGRSGRAEKKGHVIVQSLMPEHDSIQLGKTQNYQKFALSELAKRKMLFYPPYSRLVQIRLVSSREKQLKAFVKEWELFLNNVRQRVNSEDIQILGPVEMPVAKVRGKYRYHVILKIKRGLKLRDMVGYLVNDLDKRKLTGIKYMVDVDAVSLM